MGAEVLLQLRWDEGRFVDELLLIIQGTMSDFLYFLWSSENLEVFLSDYFHSK